MTQIDPTYKGKIAKLRNLKLYANSTDEEIYEAILRRERATELGIIPVKNEPSNDAKFKELFKKLQADYGVDMNDSNDVEALKMLAKHIVQRDSIDSHMARIQDQEAMSNEDTRTLKNLGDVQRGIVTSITELQDRLGINRKARKEKQIDDVPQFLDNLKKKAADFWERSTTPITCDNCHIELARLWLNFPKRPSIITLELECPKCLQKVLYVR